MCARLGLESITVLGAGMRCIGETSGLFMLGRVRIFSSRTVPKHSTSIWDTFDFPLTALRRV